MGTSLQDFGGTGKSGPWPLRGCKKASTDLLPFCEEKLEWGWELEAASGQWGHLSGPGSHSQQGCEMKPLARSLGLPLWGTSILRRCGPSPLLHACTLIAPLLRVCPLLEALPPFSRKPSGTLGPWGGSPPLPTGLASGGSFCTGAWCLGLACSPSHGSCDSVQPRNQPSCREGGVLRHNTNN